MQLRGLAAERVRNQPIEEVDPMQAPLWADRCELPVPTREEMEDWGREGPVWPRHDTPPFLAP